jgi:hypothetical protein
VENKKQTTLTWSLLFAIILAFCFLHLNNFNNPTTISIGILTILGMFFLSKELFENPIIALITAGITTFSYWAISLPSLGMQTKLLPLILVWSSYFLLKGIVTKKYSHFIFAGLLYGSGLYTYNIQNQPPLFLIIFIALLIIIKQQFLKNYWRHIMIFIVSLFIVAIPVIFDFSILKNTQIFGRNSIGFASYRYVTSNPLILLTFLLGWAYISIQFIRIFLKRYNGLEINSKMISYALLFIWLFFSLIENKTTGFAADIMPAAIIIATIPFAWVFKHMHGYSRSYKFMLTIFLVFSFVFIGIFDCAKYFIFSPKAQIDSQGLSK